MKRPLNLVICLLVPTLILLVGAFSAMSYLYKERPNLMEESGRGLIPPGFEVGLSEAGKYTIWLHTYTVYEGNAYEHEERLPEGGEVHIFDKKDGKMYELSKWVQSKKRFGSESAISLGSFETLTINRTIEVRGVGMRTPVVVSIAPNKLNDSMRVMVRVIGIACVTLFLAITALIILLHRRQNQLKEESEHP